MEAAPIGWDVSGEGWSDDDADDDDPGRGSRPRSLESTSSRASGASTTARARACPCCGCTRTNYRRRFFRAYADGYPTPGTREFLCGGPTGAGRCPRGAPAARSPLEGGPAGLARARAAGGTRRADALDMTVDHILPQALAVRAEGTPLERFVGCKVYCVRNLAPMCRGCNSSKGDRLGAVELAARALPPRCRMFVASLRSRTPPSA